MFLGGAPGQNPVEFEYTMYDSPQVNSLDDGRPNKVELSLGVRLGRPYLGKRSQTAEEFPDRFAPAIRASLLQRMAWLVVVVGAEKLERMVQTTGPAAALRNNPR